MSGLVTVMTLWGEEEGKERKREGRRGRQGRGRGEERGREEGRRVKIEVTKPHIPPQVIQYCDTYRNLALCPGSHCIPRRIAWE